MTYRISRLLLLCATTATMLFASAAAAQASPALFGFNDDWTQLNRAVTLTHDRFHANSERLQVFWQSVEPTPGHFNWYGWDQAYNTMVRNHVPPLLDVVGAPAWARDPGTCNDDIRCPQTADHDGDYAAFIQTLVRRYPAAVAIEIGNEPNLVNWVSQPDPARYAQMLKAAYPAVKQIAPMLPVITGGTCCTTIHSGGNFGAADYLNQLYNFGIRGFYDAIGFHVYPGRSVQKTAGDVESELATMRAVRNAHGDNSVFWVTETGFPSAGSSPYGSGTYNEANQATREVITYQVLRNEPDVYALYFYRLTDPAAGAITGANMGIDHHNMSPKPAQDALLKAIFGKPWPTYHLVTQGPTAVGRAKPFLLKALGGYRGKHAKNIKYEWVVSPATRAWSYTLATTSKPKVHLRIFRPGTYYLKVQMDAGLAGYLGTEVAVQVAP